MDTPLAYLGKATNNSFEASSYEAKIKDDSESDNYSHLNHQQHITNTSIWHIKIINGMIDSIKNLNDFDKQWKMEFKDQISFSVRSRINYNLNKDCTVHLSLFDSFGNEIETLNNFHQKAGRYSIEFDTNKFPSGVYYYHLLAENELQEIQKMIIIK